MSRLNRSGVCGGLFALGWLAMPATVWGQAEAAAPQEPVSKKADTPATAEQIAGWVTQLTSRDFRARRLASRQLVAAGKSAIGQVAKAADGNDLERTTRCLAVLKQLQSSDDAATKAAAGAALKRLATSRNATVARRAEAALPKPDPKAPVGGNRPGGLRILGLRAANANRVSVRVINGQRTIEAKEGTRKVLIIDSDGKDIRMTISRKVNGKLEVREVKAATPEALKKADPEAHKLYLQYTAKNGFRIQIRQGGQVLPLRGGRRVLPLPRFSPWHQQVESARNQVDAAVAKLQKLAAKPQATPEELREVLKQLVVAQKTLSLLLAVPGKPASPSKARPVPKAKPVPRVPSRPKGREKPKPIKTLGA